MATMSASYSGAHMRERDKIIEGKYQKELYALRSKIDRLRYANDDTLKQLFDMQMRALRLANSLGFKDVADAQVYIDTADHEISYKECFEEVVALRAQLAMETSRFEEAELRGRLERFGKENEKMVNEKERVSSEKDSGMAERQLSELQKRYDELLDTYERATEKSLSDYKKWRGFNAWLFSDDNDGDNKGTSAKKQRNANVMRKRRLVKEMAGKTDVEAGDTGDKDSPPPLGGIVNPFLVKAKREIIDASAVDTPQQKDFASSPLPSAAFQFKFTSTSESTRTLVNRSPELSPVGRISMPSSSPSNFLCPSSSNVTVRGAITFKPIPPSSVLQPKQQPGPTPSKAEQGRNPPDNVLPISSDTEEDTQAPKWPQQVFKVPENPALPDFPSSDTEEDAQALSPHRHEITLPTPPQQVFKVPENPALPDFPSSDTEEDAQAPSPHRHEVALLTPKSRPRPSTIRKYGQIANVDDPNEPPRKVRRIEAVGVPSTPKPSHRIPPTLITPNTSTTVSSGRKRCLSDNGSLKRKAKDKGDNKENQALPTPASNNAQGRAAIQDYSVFKGRGRYAKDDGLTKTINSKYEIDPSRNDGLKYQYDEVVRRKEVRKKMDAGDCECCRDYYEAVGILPPRLQPPLWRSPSKTEVKKKTTGCAVHKRHASDSHGHLIDMSCGDFQDESQFGLSDGHHHQIENHKKAISRHRHQWARANTPPGFWSTGFPDTQEVAMINEKAREMHRKKQEEVERSVRRGEGKYRRRS